MAHQSAISADGRAFWLRACQFGLPVSVVSANSRDTSTLFPRRTRFPGFEDGVRSRLSMSCRLESDGRFHPLHLVGRSR